MIKSLCRASSDESCCGGHACTATQLGIPYFKLLVQVKAFGMSNASLYLTSVLYICTKVLES